MKRHTPIIICLLLVISILVAYWQVADNDFINYDDTAYVTKNRNVKAGLSREGVLWAFKTRHDGNWFPLTWMSHMLDCELYGLNPMGHHWTNLLFHIANSVLLFLILQRMTQAIWESAFVAALFALHPLHVESVAWVAERKDVLSTFLGMLALLAYHRYVMNHRAINYIIVVFIYSLSLMAKPMLVTLPFILLLLDFWPLSRFQPPDHRYRTSFAGRLVALVGEKLPLFALSVASCIWTVMVQKQAGYVASLTHFSFGIRFGNAMISYLKYLGKTVWPLNLGVYYPHPETVNIGYAVLSGLFLLCMTMMVVRAARRFPYLATGWLWYLGTLVPVIGLVQVGAQSMADRYTYIPLIGLFIMVVWGVSEITARWPHQRTVLTVFSIIVLAAFMICTGFQVRYWQNSVTLFKRTLEVTTDNWLAHTRLGHALDQAGKTEKAMFHYTEALRIKPGYDAAHNNLGALLAHKGDNKAAIYHYNQVLRKHPKDAGVYNNLGVIYLNQGNTETAIRYFRDALRLNPYMEPALYNLSRIFATHVDEKYRSGKEAVALAEKLCKLTQFNHPLFMDTLAEAYAEAGRYEAAVTAVRKARNLALSYGLETMASGLEMKLKLYQAGQPYRQTFQRENE
ncbi:tetratricopeptide repeat protein [Thermodesulfobacteriota bacterium]